MTKLKKLKLAVNFCKVFSTAFAVGTAFSFLQIFWPYSDRIMAFLLLVFCGCAWALISCIQAEMEVRYNVERLTREHERSIDG